MIIEFYDISKNEEITNVQKRYPRIYNKIKNVTSKFGGQELRRVYLTLQSHLWSGDHSIIIEDYYPNGKKYVKTHNLTVDRYALKLSKFLNQFSKAA